jgi:glycosyltransferase involved in cell wall biosynthesis
MISKKTAIIEPVGGHGGMNYYDLGLANGIHNSGYDIVLYTSTETETNNEYKFPIKKTFKGIWGKSNKLLRAIKFVKCLYLSLKDAKKDNINITHFHFFHYGLQELLTLKLAKLFKFSIVITAHDVESFHGQRDSEKAKRILMMADKVIAHNYVSKEALINKISLPNSLIEVIPHGNYINLINKRPSRSVAKKSLNIDAEKIVLFFGQIKQVKGLEYLLHAFKAVLAEYPKAKLVIAGKLWKDEWCTYGEIINSHHIEDSIIKHIHYIADEDVSNYYCAADLIVLPYKEIYQSGVLLMAMSYKTPVIVSDIKGMTEVVSHDKNGFIFNSEDTVDLAKKINTALGNEELRLKVARQAFIDMEQSYDWDRIGKKTTDLYTNIISNQL